MQKALLFFLSVFPALLFSQTYDELIATPDLSQRPTPQTNSQQQEGYQDELSDVSFDEQKEDAPPIIQTREVNIEQPIIIDQIIEITNYITNDFIDPSPIELTNKKTVNVSNTLIRNVYSTQPLSPNIFIAILYGRMDDVLMFIERGTYNPNTLYEDGNSLLHLALYRPATINIAAYLVQKGADINSKNRLGQSPLHIAVLRSNLPGVELLVNVNASVSAKDNINQTPLWLANIMGQESMLKLLAASYQNQAPNPVPHPIIPKAFPKVPSMFDLYNNRDKQLSYQPISKGVWHQTLYKNDSTALQSLLKKGYNPTDIDEKGQNALHIAAFYDNIEAIRYLLSQGISVNTKDKFGNLPLHIAAGRSSVDTVALLIDAGSSVAANNNNGWTPLFEASLLGNLPVVDYLLQKGVSPNVRNKAGRTPIHEAARLANTDILIALADKGAVIYAADKDGKTPLYLAAEAGNIQAAAQLIRRGSPVDTETKEGLTPLHIAVRNGYFGLVQYLMEVGKANMFIPDFKGRYPLETAYTKGNDNIIAYLASQYTKAQASLQDSEPTMPTPPKQPITPITPTPAPIKEVVEPAAPIEENEVTEENIDNTDDAAYQDSDIIE